MNIARIRKKNPSPSADDLTTRSLAGHVVDILPNEGVHLHRPLAVPLPPRKLGTLKLNVVRCELDGEQSDKPIDRLRGVVGGLVALHHVSSSRDRLHDDLDLHLCALEPSLSVSASTKLNSCIKKIHFTARRTGGTWKEVVLIVQLQVSFQIMNPLILFVNQVILLYLFSFLQFVQDLNYDKRVK